MVNLLSKSPKLQNGERFVYRSPEGVQYNPDASTKKCSKSATMEAKK